MKQPPQLSSKRKQAPDPAPNISSEPVNKRQRTTDTAASSGTSTRASTVTLEEIEDVDAPPPRASHKGAKKAIPPNPWLGMSKEQLGGVRGEHWPAA